MMLFWIFNLSFETSEVTEKLKLPVVVSIHKSGSTTNCRNYRPIYLLSSVAKVYEKLRKPKNTCFFLILNSIFLLNLR